jgi:hypothetical protein
MQQSQMQPNNFAGYSHTQLRELVKDVVFVFLYLTNEKYPQLNPKQAEAKFWEWLTGVAAIPVDRLRDKYKSLTGSEYRTILAHTHDYYLKNKGKAVAF